MERWEIPEAPCNPLSFRPLHYPLKGLFRHQKSAISHQTFSAIRETGVMLRQFKDSLVEECVLPSYLKACSDIQ
jgi:hypothetical protein